jgi:hypothetical protein
VSSQYGREGEGEGGVSRSCPAPTRARRPAGRDLGAEARRGAQPLADLLAAEFPAVRRPRPGLAQLRPLRPVACPMRPLRPVACPIARARPGLRLPRPPFGRSSVCPQLCAKMKSKMQVVGVVNSVCPAEHSHPGAHNYQVAPVAPPRSTPAGPPREQERPRASARAESARAATPYYVRGRRRTCCTGRTASPCRCGGWSSACPSPASSRTTSRRFPPVQILADSSRATWGRPSPRTPVRSWKASQRPDGHRAICNF